MATAELRCADGSPVSRLGLAAGPATQAAFVPAALEAGVSLFFFYSLESPGMSEGLAGLGERRDAVAIATGTEERSPGQVEDCLDQVCRRLGTDWVDGLFALYVHPGESLGELLGEGGVFPCLHRLKAQGRIRWVGASVHSRPLAVELVRSGQVDVLMHRYNMAHRGAEEAVWTEALRAGVPAVAFTCTRWGRLLSGHRRWRGDLPTAADCYRFALAHPAVRVALTSPASLAELEDNLAVLERPAATEAELRAWREYGALVYGAVGDDFERDWP